MGDYILVHLNVVRPVVPITAFGETEQYFTHQLQRIFLQAASFAGLKWHVHGARLPDGSYLALPEFFTFSSASASDNPHVMTMAGWQDARALHQFSHRLRDHVDGMKALRDWVDRSEGATMVMWWSERSKRVKLDDGWERLQHLRVHGPSPDAFNMQQRFEAPDAGDTALRVTG